MSFDTEKANQLEQLFRKLMEEFTPGTLVRRFFETHSSLLEADRPVYMISTGKASVAMARTGIEIVGKQFREGLVVTPKSDDDVEVSGCRIYEASHPVPDESSVKAGEAVLDFIREVPSGSLLIYNLSGGTSSLMCRPAEGISVDDLNRAYELLNNSGATIREINTVRKHLSRIKGGQLLREVKEDVSLVDLVISDVPNDELEIIGSGPTTPDSSTFADARDIVDEYALWEQLPDPVREHIREGIEGERSETLKPGEELPGDHQTHIVGSARQLAGKASDYAEQRGYRTEVAGEAYNKDVEDVASMIAEEALDRGEGRSTALVYYGESTVQVDGDGKGGRNQELALRGALKIRDHDHITWLSAGTDGIDGPTDAAGAIVSGQTISRARAKGLDPESFLENNDAYHFHEQAGTLLKTGPTGNNLMDIQIVLVD